MVVTCKMHIYVSWFQNDFKMAATTAYGPCLGPIIRRRPRSDPGYRSGQSSPFTAIPRDSFPNSGISPAPVWDPVHWGCTHREEGDEHAAPPCPKGRGAGNNGVSARQRKNALGLTSTPDGSPARAGGPDARRTRARGRRPAGAHSTAALSPARACSSPAENGRGGGDSPFGPRTRL